MDLLRVGDKPIPGYVLVRRLGQGGFGSVWEAKAPGDKPCALKFLNLGSNLGLKEYRAIRLLRNIEHTNLVPIAAIYLRDGNGNILGREDDPGGTAEFQAKNCELVIHLGLGKKSLADYLTECRSGQPKDAIAGLPADDLLRYMTQAASAIDFLNRKEHDLGGPAKSSLRHGDIKPGNMLLVGDGIWVCDFGLAGLLSEGDIRTSASKPMYTPAYAAPEIINDFGPSQFSDQYSLAVSYVELRSGRLPYDAETRNAVEALISIGAVELGFLPATEQKVLKRALSMKPEDRYATCTEFVNALKASISDNSGRLGRPPIAEELFSRDSTVVPGFRLEKCLGRGGYGEVWQASGSRMKAALKIVKDLTGAKGRQEWRALEAIKEELDHPHLMRMQDYWLLDAWGQVISVEEQNRPDGPKPAYLVIHTELAAKNLMDRLKECHENGRIGIPPDELLEYMRQAADALDYLNLERHSFGDRDGFIIHRDIKPENILLTRNKKVKISDFGLAKMMEGSYSAVSQASQGQTLIYGAPELHKQKLSRWTDQYSLAVTYYHLRTGELPIDTSLPMLQLMMKSSLGELDLSRLAEAERLVIARGTQVNPEQRFDSCTQMVESLFAAIGVSPAHPTSHPSFPDSGAEMSGHSKSSDPTPSPLTEAYQPLSTPVSGMQFDSQSGAAAAVAENKPPVHAADPEVLKRHGLPETLGPGTFPEVIRDTPGMPNRESRRDRMRTFTEIKSSGTIEIPKELREEARKELKLDLDDDFDNPLPPNRPAKVDWRNRAAPTPAASKAPQPSEWQASAPAKSKAPVVAILGGVVGLLGVAAFAIWATMGPKKTNESNPEPVPAVAELEKILAIASPTTDDGAKADERLRTIEKEQPAQYAELSKRTEEWKKKIPGKISPPPPPPPVQAERDIIAKQVSAICADDYPASKSEIQDLQAKLAKLKQSANSADKEVAQSSQAKLSTKKKSIGAKKLSAIVRSIPTPPYDPKQFAGAFRPNFEELRDFWLAGAELSATEKSSWTAIQALAQGWFDNKSDKIKDLVQGDPSANLYAQLLFEYLRLSKFGERGNTLQSLWAKRNQMQDDARSVLDAYRDGIRKKIQAAVTNSPGTEASLKTLCAEARELDPNDALVMLVETEARFEKADGVINPDDANRLRDRPIGREPGLNPSYVRYIRAVVQSADDLKTAADDLAALYPAKPPADPMLAAAPRRRRAASVLMAAVNSRQRETSNPFVLPYDSDSVPSVATWLDAECRLDPANRKAWCALAAVATFGKTPNKERAADAVRELSKSWPDEKTAAPFGFFMNLIHADSMAHATASNVRIEALKSYIESLRQLQRLGVRLRGSSAMARLKALFQTAIDLGEDLKKADGRPDVDIQLAKVYGLRGDWIYDHSLEWGYVDKIEGWKAAYADYKKALSMAHDGTAEDAADRANFRVGQINTELKLNAKTPAEAETETEALCKLRVNTPRPLGLLASLKVKRAIEFMSKDRAKSDELFDASLSAYESAIALCHAPDDNLRCAIFHDNASRICRTLAAEGIRKDENLAKMTSHAEAAAKLQVFDDALGWSSQGKLLEDQALTRGEGAFYPQAIAAFDKAITHESKPQYYVDRGRITYRGVAFGPLKWSDLKMARSDLTRVAGSTNSKDATPLVRAEANYFLSLVELLEHNLKASATAMEKSMTIMPPEAVDQRFAYLFGRGRALVFESQWLKERQRSVPEDLVKEVSAIAEKTAQRDRFESAWLRGMAKSLSGKASRSEVAEIFLSELPKDFPGNVSGLIVKGAAADKKNMFPGLLPLLGWTKLYLESSDIYSKDDFSPQKMCQVADVLADLGRVNANQDIWLWATASATAGQTYALAANRQGVEPPTEQAYRERAIELLTKAVDLVSPKLPTTWKWRYDLAVELNRSLDKREDLKAEERAKRIALAQKILKQAQDEATDDGQTKILELLQNLSQKH